MRTRFKKNEMRHSYLESESYNLHITYVWVQPDAQIDEECVDYYFHYSDLTSS